VETVDEKGRPEKVRKFDWALEGNVAFESAAGYSVQSAELRFDSAEGVAYSDRGVKYRIPTGETGVLVGTADRFAVAVNRGTGGISRWEMRGDIRLSTSEKDEVKHE
jgi:hypothetical protein